MLALLLLPFAIPLAIGGELVANSEASASPLNASDDPGWLQGTGTDTSAALEFEANVFPLFDQQFVLPPLATHSEHQYDSVFGSKYFGEIVTAKRSASDSAITYAVENLYDRGLYQICGTVSTSGGVSYNSSNCEDVLIGVHSTNGRLYLYFDDGGMAHKKKYRLSFYMQDFEPQRVEMSARESSGALKIYRDIVVTPPDRTPDCSDYPTRDRLRYTCLFLGELLSQDLPDTTTTLTDGLPDRLTQAKSSYQLVMSEEFEGTPSGTEGDACRNGMTLIDEQTWTYHANPCDNVDASGAPCENVANGRLSFGLSKTCRNGMSTRGKFEFKYGYMEFQWSFNLKREDQWMNAAAALGDPRGSERMILPRYGVDLVGYQDVLTFTPIEIDLTEFVLSQKNAVMHRFLESPALSDNLTDYPKRSSTRGIRFCDDPLTLRAREIGFTTLSSLDCDETANDGKGARIAVTVGIEWTPAGYREFIKVHGASSYQACGSAVGSTVSAFGIEKQLQGDHSCYAWDVVTKEVPEGGFILLSPEQLSLLEAGPGAARPNVHLTSDEIMMFIGTHTDDVRLEQFAVSHLPLSIGTSMWSVRTPAENITYEVQFEYFRVYQPMDHYSQMEPVYK